MKIQFLSLLLLILYSCTQDPSENQINTAEVKSTESADKGISSFIPTNYSILDSAFCDLNGDNLKDIILILKHKDEDSLTNEGIDSPVRPCIILFGNSKKQFDFYARNDSIVLCLDCGGMMGDPYAGLETTKGEFTVNHAGGSNVRWTNNLTFKFDQSDKKIYLKNIESAAYNLMLLEDENEDIDKYIEKNTKQLTSKDFGKIAFENYVNE